ncbi:MAG: hypothetical protein AB1644_08935 [Candidatus Zixiibacteriota bacterium]
MKAASLTVVCALFLIFSWYPCGTQAQTISVDEVVGLFRNDTVKTETPITFKLRFTNPEALNFSISNGFEIYSPDGAEWDHLSVAGDTLTGAIPRSNWDLQFAMNVFLGAGVPPADTVGILGAKINGVGLPSLFNGVPYGIKIGSLTNANDGKHICLDSAWFRPGGTWKWVASGGINRYPTWGGPYCYYIYQVPDLMPSITNAPASLSGRHCVTMSYDFNGSDPEGETVTFQKVSGPGSINSTTGLWSYTPSLADVGQSLTLVVQACEPHGCGSSVSVPLTFTNEVPTFTSGCRDTMWVAVGNSVTKDMNASDGCSDPLHFVLGPVTPSLDGTVSINASTGLITFSTTGMAVVGVYDVSVYASDTKDSVLCHTYFRVSASCCLGIRGNVSGDAQDRVDLLDVVYLVDYLFAMSDPPPPLSNCPDENNADGSPDNVIDISDLTALVSYLFYGEPLAPCPAF